MFIPVVAILMALASQPIPPANQCSKFITPNLGGLKAVVFEHVGDNFGPPRSGATIRLVATNGKSWETTSDSEGRFFAGGLPPGVYRLEVRKNGFAPFEYREIEIRANRWLLGVPPMPYFMQMRDASHGPFLDLTHNPNYQGQP